MQTVEEIVALLGLEPLQIEGGLFRQTYVAADVLAADSLPERYGRTKSVCTAIYYLLTDKPNSFSALHRLPTDEIYHFYLGDPVEMLLLYPDGHSEIIWLGHDLSSGEEVQFVVPAGTWQGSRVAEGGDFSLMGTTMAPGFDAGDYEAGLASELEMDYPDRAELIRRLTR
jgi:predicted cupin superfamily sugar epimerase